VIDGQERVCVMNESVSEKKKRLRPSPEETGGSSIIEEDLFPTDDSQVIEVPLLLPGWQMSALERAAYLRGLTAAEMVRQLLNDFISAEVN